MKTRHYNEDKLKITKARWEVYKNNELVAENDNKIVNSGKQFFADILNGNFWTTEENKYMGFGSNSNTNAGVLGPLTGIRTVHYTGAWQGPSLYDWKLSSEYSGLSDVRPLISSTREGNTITMKANISPSNYDANIEAGESGYIRELGLFLTGTYSELTGDPTESTATDAQRKAAMISRVVFYNLDESNDVYEDDGIEIEYGDELRIKYIVVFG